MYFAEVSTVSGNNRRVRGVLYNVKLSFALLWLGAALLAQTPDASLHLATAGGKISFRLGEPIALELSFASTAT